MPGRLPDLSSALDVDGESLSYICRLLGVEVRPSWWVITSRPDIQPEVKLGRIFCIGGHSLKCVCSLHGAKCNLFLRIEGVGYHALERLLVKWVCSGYGMPPEAHIRSRDDFYLKYHRGGS